MRRPFPLQYGYGKAVEDPEVLSSHQQSTSGYQNRQKGILKFM
jgi:hypothetical protein